MEKVTISKKRYTKLLSENKQLKRELTYLQNGLIEKLLKSSLALKLQLVEGKKYTLEDIRP